MTRKLKPIYFFTLVILLFLSCEKEEKSYPKVTCPISGTYQPISNNMFDFKFKPGTYWVFIDSVSGNTDSMYVTSFGEGTDMDVCNNEFQFYTFTTVSYPGQNTTNYLLEVFMLRKAANSHGAGIIIYESDVSFDSLFIYNQHYYNVSKKEILVDHSETGNKTIYYINPMYGFLKTDFFDSNNILISQKILRQKNIVR